jgi:hypothetical protein
MNITGICKICQNLSPTEVDDLFQDSRRIIRDIEPTVLQLSAREGCVFCQVIIEAIELVLGKNLIDDSLNPDRISDTESSDPLVSDIDIIARLHHPVQLRLWPAPTIRIALSGTLCKLFGHHLILLSFCHEPVCRAIVLEGQLKHFNNLQ